MTHIFDEEAHRPICGTPMHKDARYEWCYPDWKNGPPECERCLKKQLKMLTAEFEANVLSYYKDNHAKYYAKHPTRNRSARRRQVA